jgi:hypothetical protein
MNSKSRLGAITTTAAKFDVTSKSIAGA